MRNVIRTPDMSGWLGVDFFCGGGGSTTGAAMAGMRMAAGVNHWVVALATHAANHPLAHPFHENINTLDPEVLFPHVGEPLKRKKRLMAWGSPSCTGHSDARGEDRPHHDEARMTATGFQHCLEVLLPDDLVTENVEEFLDWSSLHVMAQKGWRQRLTDRITVYRGSKAPTERRAGKLFMAWKAFLEGLGYRLTVNIVNSMHFGVPQERERVIICGSLHRQPPPLLYPEAPCIVTAAEVLDFDDPAPKWTSFSKIRSAATRASIERGIKDGCGDRFIKLYYSNGSGLTGRRLDRPLPTIPAADVVALVDCTRGREPMLRVATVKELKRGMSFPDDYVVMGSTKSGRGPIVRYEDGGARSDVTAQLGNAVPPLLAKAVIEQMAA